MKDVIEKKDLVPLFEQISMTMNEGESELSRLDSLMGDGDLGLTMTKGFASLPAEIYKIEDEPLAKILMTAGMKMSSVVPSTMGFLMSSGLMNAGKNLKGHESIGPDEYVLFLQGFSDGIIKRGKCELSDRTILDVIKPSAQKAEEMLNANPSISLSALAEGVDEAAKGYLEATKQMVPKFGKAAVHKDRAAEHVDQGGLAGYYLIHGINLYINK